MLRSGDGRTLVGGSGSWSGRESEGERSSRCGVGEGTLRRGGGMGGGMSDMGAG